LKIPALAVCDVRFAPPDCNRTTATPTTHATGLFDRKETSMNRKFFRTIVAGNLWLFGLIGTACQAAGQDPKAPYPAMAPLEQYLMADRNAEIALARSAAPESIARDAEVLVLGSQGYESAVKGKNGFVCMVERSWTAGIDDPEFWNPKLRSPICFNPAGARSYIPLVIKKTASVIAGDSKETLAASLNAAFEKKELPPMEPGAMSYMLSKQGKLNDRAGHWHPHLMFFVPKTDAQAWGADLPGSPVLSDNDDLDRLTVFFIPVAKWSDGSSDTTHVH
jgi:hypothetical protein